MIDEYKKFLDEFTTDELRQKVYDAANSYADRAEMVREADEDALKDIFGGADLKSIDRLSLDDLIVLRENAFNLVPDGVGGRFINKIINDIRIVTAGVEIIAARVQSIRS